jgi:hypothetical protein
MTAVSTNPNKPLTAAPVSPTAPLRVLRRSSSEAEAWAEERAADDAAEERSAADTAEEAADGPEDEDAEADAGVVPAVTSYPG